MKKFISIWLATALMAGCLILGAEAAPSDFEDSLTVHYDFSDDPSTADVNEALQNKAPLHKDAYTAKTHGNVLFETGTVKGNGGGIYIPKTEIADLIAGGLYDSASNTGGKAVEYSMLIRFKIENPVPDKEYRLIDCRTFGGESVRPICIYIKNNRISFNFGTALNTADAKSFNKPVTELEQWYNIAFTVGTGADGKLDLTVYATNGLPETAADWGTPLIRCDVGDTVAPCNEHLWIAWKNGGGTGVSVDDFRIYSRAASIEELASVLPASDALRTVNYFGVQQSAVTNGTYGLRFIGTVDGLLYSEAGFELTAETNSGTRNLSSPCKTVYNRLLSSEDGVQAELTAEETDGRYLMALSVIQIPPDEGDLTFTVRAYGKTNGKTVYSEAYQIKVTCSGGTVSVETLNQA